MNLNNLQSNIDMPFSHLQPKIFRRLIQIRRGSFHRVENPLRKLFLKMMVQNESQRVYFLALIVICSF